jgi:hypothetical protein
MPEFLIDLEIAGRRGLISWGIAVKGGGLGIGRRCN